MKGPSPFRRSAHLLHIDAGSDDAIESEIQALTGPYYDLHRLGLFFTNSPRHADVLLVTGPVTRNMRDVLLRAYEAMAEPRIVVAVGTDACDGGMFRTSPETLGGVDGLLPVDVYVPGSPPPPHMILSGILLALGKRAGGAVAVPGLKEARAE